MRTELLAFIARLLFLPLLVVSVAFLVKGYSSPGGGFAGGAIAGVAVLLQRLVFGARRGRSLVRLPARELALGGGLLLALGATVGPALAGDALLSHYPAPGEEVTHLGALELHTNLVFDAGVYLLVFGFVLQAIALLDPDGGQGEGEGEERA